jgi:hypothetical protein
MVNVGGTSTVASATTIAQGGSTTPMPFNSLDQIGVAPGRVSRFAIAMAPSTMTRMIATASRFDHDVKTPGASCTPDLEARCQVTKSGGARGQKIR